LLRSIQIILQAATGDNNNMQLEYHMPRIVSGTDRRRGTGNAWHERDSFRKIYEINAQQMFAQGTL
jgi:hypothetical protein